MANFTDDKKKAVWQNAKTVDKFDPDKFRQDACSAWMAWDNFGLVTTIGWCIDHTLPVAKGGTDHTDNLRAMHWENNRSKADDFPTYKSAVTAKEKENIPSVQELTIHDTALRKLKELYPNNNSLATVETK